MANDFSDFLTHRYSELSDAEFDALTDDDHKRLINEWSAQFTADNHKVFLSMVKDLDIETGKKTRK